MAWTDVTYSCGHEGREQMTGPHRDRESRVALIGRSKLCPECYAKELEETRSREFEAAKRSSEEMKLPDLTGTEKQVAWATKIRADIFSKNLTLLGEITDQGLLEYSKARILKMREQTTAKYWIDGRDTLVRTQEGLVRLYSSYQLKNRGLEILNS